MTRIAAGSHGVGAVPTVTVQSARCAEVTPPV
jgi:hypothetical protein